MFDENGLFRASNVYQHVCMYMGFTMSGLVDFLGMYIPLPEGSEQVGTYIKIAFFIFNLMY